MNDVGRELPAGTLALLDEHAVDIDAGLGRPADLVGRPEPRRAAPDDDDLLHVVSPSVVQCVPRRPVRVRPWQPRSENA